MRSPDRPPDHTGYAARAQRGRRTRPDRPPKAPGQTLRELATDPAYLAVKRLCGERLTPRELAILEAAQGPETGRPIGGGE